MNVERDWSSCRRSVWWIAMIVAALTTACTPDRICAPGLTQVCACPAGAKGSQACRAGGDGWNECVCPKLAAAAPPVCSAGASQACACADGQKGAQTCDSRGTRWEACACSEPEVVPSSPDDRPANTTKTAPVVGSSFGSRHGGLGPRGTGQATKAEPAIGPRPYSVEVARAVFGPTAAGGAKWDPMGDGPDVFAVVTVQGAGAGIVRTTVVKDSTRPTWRQRGTVTINVGDEILVRLADKDALADDDIAVFRERFDGPRTYRFSDPQRSVESLEINITPTGAVR